MTTHAATTDHENSFPGETRIMDCNSLVGRLRDICRGHDDSGNPVLTPRQCNAYRRSWGLGDLPNAKSTPPVHAAKAKTVPEPKPPKPKRDQRATLPPCVHLRDVIRDESCRLCGGRSVTAHVHGCEIHGECTQNNYGLKGAAKYLATCIRCLDYSEIGGLETVPK